MPKGRHLKVETWTDDKFVTLSPLARLLFMGMWNYACDNGHVEDNAVQLKMRILPMDSCDIGALINEMLSTGQVTRGDGYLKVAKLVEHQRIDLRYLTLCEWCAHDVHSTFTEADKKGRPLSARRAPTVHTVGAHGVHEDDGDGDGDGDGEVTTCAPAAAGGASETNLFDEFWDVYDKKLGRKKAEQKYRLALKKRGVTHELLTTAAASYVAAQRSKGKHPEYTKDAATWLNGEHWNDDLDATARPVDDQPSWRPESVPPCPPHVADDPVKYARWIQDWSAGHEVPIDGGGTARRQVRA